MSDTRSLSEKRRAQTYLNYKGKIDLRTIQLEGPKGPNTVREMQWPVSVEYDEESDTSRVGFTLIPPPNFKTGDYVDI
jgi:hypothetical protein